MKRCGLSFEEVCRYKYMLNVGSNGYANKLKYLFLCGSVVIWVRNDPHSSPSPNPSPNASPSPNPSPNPSPSPSPSPDPNPSLRALRVGSHVLAAAAVREPLGVVHTPG